MKRKSLFSNAIDLLSCFYGFIWNNLLPIWADFESTDAILLWENGITNSNFKKSVLNLEVDLMKEQDATESNELYITKNAVYKVFKTLNLEIVFKEAVVVGNLY